MKHLSWSVRSNLKRHFAYTAGRSFSNETCRTSFFSFICWADELLLDVLNGRQVRETLRYFVIELRKHTRHSVFSRTTTKSTFGFASGVAAT